MPNCSEQKETLKELASTGTSIQILVTGNLIPFRPLIFDVRLDPTHPYSYSQWRRGGLFHHESYVVNHNLWRSLPKCDTDYGHRPPLNRRAASFILSELSPAPAAAPTPVFSANAKSGHVTWPPHQISMRTVRLREPQGKSQGRGAPQCNKVIYLIGYQSIKNSYLPWTRS